MSYATTLEEVLALRSENAQLRGQVEQLTAFVREVANCERSDNQNIRRAKELLAVASTNQTGAA